MTWHFTDQAREALINSLSKPTAPYPASISDADKGGKFLPDGSVLPHPGNTFIFHLDPNSEAYRHFCAFQDALRDSRWAEYLTFLPQSSFHMTLFCGISGKPLGADGWPQGFSAETTCDEMTQTFIQRLQHYQGQENFTVAIDGFHTAGSLALTPQGNDELRLRAMRDDLRELTGFHRPDHDDYAFHSGFAYLKQWMPVEAAKAYTAELERLYNQFLLGQHFTLSAVEFCQFDNMHHFSPLGKLTAQGWQAQP